MTVKETQLRLLQESISFKIQEGLRRLEEEVGRQKDEIYKLKESIVMYSARECEQTEKILELEQIQFEFENQIQSLKVRKKDVKIENENLAEKLLRLKKENQMVNKVNIRSLAQS